jgi:hypothetical protein
LGERLEVGQNVPGRDISADHDPLRLAVSALQQPIEKTVNEAFCHVEQASLEVRADIGINRVPIKILNGGGKLDELGGFGGEMRQR